jgi:hypothetical protein
MTQQVDGKFFGAAESWDAAHIQKIINGAIDDLDLKLQEINKKVSRMNALQASTLTLSRSMKTQN